MAHAGKFKVAIVGVGTESAKEFLPEVFYSHTTKLVAVCDENPDTLKKVCEAYMINGYHTYQDLIENEEIDFAIISTKNGTENRSEKKSKARNKEGYQSNLATSATV